MKRLSTVFLLGLLSACDGSGGVQVETAWCDEMLDSDVMARSLRGELPGQTVADAQEHCVLVPIGTSFDIIEETQNAFMQTYLKAEIVRPDTGKPAQMWVRKSSAGIE